MFACFNNCRCCDASVTPLTGLQRERIYVTSPGLRNPLQPDGVAKNKIKKTSVNMAQCNAENGKTGSETHWLFALSKNSQTRQ